MSQTDPLPSFDEWVEYVFTHAAAEAKHLDWSKADDPSLRRWLRFFFTFDLPSPISAYQEMEYRIRLLSDPQVIVRRYSEEQIAAAVDLLFESGDEFHCDILQLPLSDGFYVQYLDALASFYVRFFDTEMPDSSGRTWCKRLNYTASMMWDGKGPAYFPVLAQLPCLERILFECRSECCILCALHGLGHLARYEEWQPASAAVIDRFLAERPVSEDVREYALEARRGEVM